LSEELSLVDLSPKTEEEEDFASPAPTLIDVPPNSFGPDPKFHEHLQKIGKSILKKLELVSEIGWFSSLTKLFTGRSYDLQTFVFPGRAVKILTQYDGIEGMLSFPELDSANGPPPAEWWSHEEDCHLLLGSYFHGYGRYQAIRRDSNLCFSKRKYDSKGMKQYVDLKSIH